MNIKRYHFSLFLSLCLATISTQALGAVKQKPRLTVELKAAVIMVDGRVVPAARTEFLFSTYSLDKVRTWVKPSTDPGPKPDIDDRKYGTDCNDDLDVCFGVNAALYSSDLAVWESKAYPGVDKIIAKIQAQNDAAGIPTYVKATTDLTGVASVSVPAGTWYVTGSYKVGKASVHWRQVPFVINAQTKKIELANDNGNVYN